MPALRISDAAKAELVSTMNQIGGSNLVACIAWVQRASYTRRDEAGSVQSSDRGPHWGLGFYASSQIPAEEVAEISGIRFTFDPADVERLDNATLDINESGWVVEKRAI